MRRLVLIKHALPEMIPSLPAHQWHLGAEGQRRARLLAGHMQNYRPAWIASSREPKALETAQIIADHLACPVTVVDGLQEHERDAYPFVAHERFVADIARVFAEPDIAVMGHETANQTRVRFAQTVAATIERSDAENILIVTHGTALTLYVAHLMGIAPFSLWQRLGLPAYIVLSLPDMSLDTVVEELLD